MTLAERIAEMVEQHGSLRAVARVIQCEVGYLSRLANGEKVNPGKLFLSRMGLRRVVTYERIPGSAVPCGVPGNQQGLPDAS